MEFVKMKIENKIKIIVKIIFLIPIIGIGFSFILGSEILAFLCVVLLGTLMLPAYIENEKNKND